MKLDQTIFQKWNNDCKKIKGDLMTLLEYQQVYNYFIKMTNDNFGHIESNEGLYFCDFVRKCYGIQAACGVRRHTKVDSDSISLMKLLKQMN